MKKRIFLLPILVLSALGFSPGALGMSKEIAEKFARLEKSFFSPDYRYLLNPNWKKTFNHGIFYSIFLYYKKKAEGNEEYKKHLKEVELFVEKYGDDEKAMNVEIRESWFPLAFSMHRMFKIQDKETLPLLFLNSSKTKEQNLINILKFSFEETKNNVLKKVLQKINPDYCHFTNNYLFEKSHFRKRLEITKLLIEKQPKNLSNFYIYIGYDITKLLFVLAMLDIKIIKNLKVENLYLGNDKKILNFFDLIKTYLTTEDKLSFLKKTKDDEDMIKQKHANLKNSLSNLFKTMELEISGKNPMLEALSMSEDNLKLAQLALTNSIGNIKNCETQIFRNLQLTETNQYHFNLLLKYALFKSIYEFEESYNNSHKTGEIAMPLKSTEFYKYYESLSFKEKKQIEELLETKNNTGDIYEFMSSAAIKNDFPIEHEIWKTEHYRRLILGNSTLKDCQVSCV